MRFQGSTDFLADRADIWAFLVDPSRMGPCAPIPIERVDDTHFRASTRVGSGFLATRVSLELELVEAVENQRARLAGHGRGSGTVLTGSTSFQLRNGAMDGMTTVDWEAEIELEGLLAGPAGRVVAERGEKAVADLLDCIRRQVEQ